MTRVRIYDKNVKGDGAEAAPGTGLGLVKAVWSAVRPGRRMAPPGLRGPIIYIYIAIGARNNYYQNRVRAASGEERGEPGGFPAGD
jgi:hypothetical protein